MRDFDKVVAPNIHAAVISNGVVFLKVARNPIFADLRLRVGSRESGFEPLDPSQSTALTLDIGHRPSKLDIGGLAQSAQIQEGGEALKIRGSAEFTQKTLGVEAGINVLPNWFPERLRTLQIIVLERNKSHRIPIDARLVIPASADPLVFQVGLAAHRCRAQLLLQLYQRVEREEGALRESREIPWRSANFDFDKGWHGGPSVEAFQQIQWLIPPRDFEVTLSLELNYQGFTALAEHPDPLLMLLDPRVSSLARPDAVKIFEVLRPPTSEQDGAWVSAPVPDLLSSGDNLVLCSEDSELVLMSAVDIEVQLLEDFGHSLVLTATDPEIVIVRLDGEPIYHGPLAVNGTSVRLPNRFLTGQIRRLDVVNVGVTQTYFVSATLTPRILTSMEILQAESSPPFPNVLSPLEGYRFDSLRQQLGLGLGEEAQRQVAWALEALETGPAQLKLKPLAFPIHEFPDISIVIPAHNHLFITYLALCSLLLAPNRLTFEVILVDDASTDDTFQIEKLVSGITVVRHAFAQRFIRACNSGAERARGRFIVLLNNDVEVTPGWLDELADAFERFDRVGLVGSKLIYPNGRLQEAGGIVWGSGNPWNYGRNQSPWDPRFCYARRADYVSGAALMTTREVWDRVGGLSQELEPMYFEDTDFAFKVREAGFSTWFVPSSIVIHYEGVTSGTDHGSGFKRFQEVNRPKFKRRWAGAYAFHGREGIDPDLEKDRGVAGRVLFIDYAPPRPDRDAGSYAAVQEMKLVQSLGYKVTFLPRNLAHLGKYSDDLGRMGVEQVYAPFFLSPTEFLEKRGREFDAIFITRFYVAEDVLDLVDRFAPEARVLFNNADLHFLRELRAGLAAGDLGLVARARETREHELAVMRRVHVVLSYSDVEHAVIESHAEGGVKVVKAPWVVAIPAEVPDIKRRQGLSFLGNYNHPPNLEAVEWLAREVLPRIESVHPGRTLHVYGASAPKALREMARPGLVVEGFIKDVAEAYGRHRIFVAPLQSGAGIKGKVLGALAHGIPCVLSPIAAEGVGLRSGTDCLVAATPDEWVAAILRLEGDDALWHTLSEAGRAYVFDAFSFDRARALMRRAFEEAGLFPRGA